MIKPAKHFEFLVKIAGVPEPETEYRFDAARRWRFDYAWPARKIAVEIDGGNWAQTNKARWGTGAGVAGHNSGTGRDRDNEKQNAAVVAGWKVLRYTASSLKREAEIVDLLKALLK